MVNVTPREKCEQILDEYERSGMSGAAFAALVGVKYPTLSSWIQQRRKNGAAATVRWAEAGNAEQALWAGQMLRAMGVERC